jgi:hypothetical protein
MTPNSTRSDEIITPRLPAKGSAWRRWLMPLALIAAALALQALASRNPRLVERYYSRKLFPAIIHALSLINGIVGFSIGEVMIYGLAAALVGTLIYQAREIYLRRKRIARLLRFDLLVLMWMTGSAMMLFLLIWGLNYQREPLGGNWGSQDETQPASN